MTAAVDRLRRDLLATLPGAAGEAGDAPTPRDLQALALALDLLAPGGGADKVAAALDRLSATLLTSDADFVEVTGGEVRLALHAQIDAAPVGDARRAALIVRYEHTDPARLYRLHRAKDDDVLGYLAAAARAKNRPAARPKTRQTFTAGDVRDLFAWLDRKGDAPRYIAHATCAGFAWSQVADGVNPVVDHLLTRLSPDEIVAAVRGHPRYKSAVADWLET